MEVNKKWQLNQLEFRERIVESQNVGKTETKIAELSIEDKHTKIADLD